MKHTDKYVGLDVHKDTITVAIAEGVRLGEVRLYGKISNDLHSLERLLPKLGGEKVSIIRGHHERRAPKKKLPQSLLRPLATSR